MKLIFTNYPFSKDEAFIYGLENQDAVNEFLQLFNLAEIGKNKRCQLPDKNKLNQIMNKIYSQELKNIFTKYVGREILVIPETDDYILPTETHCVKL